MEYRLVMVSSRNNSAFTLTEMLTVVAIIGILAALILSALSSATRLGRRAACAHNLRQLDLAVQEYVQQNHVYPRSPETELNRELGSADDSLLPKRENGKWTSEKGIGRCPSAIRPISWPTNLGYNSYGYNACGFLAKGTFPNADVIWDAHGLAGQNGPWPGRYPPVTESEVANPSDMIALGDGFLGNENFVRGGGGLARVTDPPSVVWDKKEPWERHQGKANIAFCDGHVESPTLKSLFVDTSDEALSRWNRDDQPHREKLSP